VARPGLLVDSGGLVAIANAKDRFHPPALAVLSEFFGDLITTWPAVTEACHIVPAHLGAELVDKLSLAPWRVLGMAGAAPRLAELLRRYADRPMDLADASMVWAAERGGTYRILTVDRTDFEIYRTKTGRSFDIVP
jgi:predicted nucleic acid-binding protein